MVTLFRIPRGCGQEVSGKVQKTLRAFSEKGAIEMEGPAVALDASHTASRLSFRASRKGSGSVTSSPPPPPQPPLTLFSENEPQGPGLTVHENPLQQRV